MGPRNSKQTTSNFMNDYEVIQKNQSESLTYLQHKRTQEEFLLRQFNFNDKKQCDKTLNKLAELKNKLAGNKHVVPLKDYLTSTQDQYCSTFYKIYALFQHPQRTLDDQINQRNLQKRKFSETELWSILASCILGLSHLQKNGIKHLSLKSNNILLSQEGIIRIADPFATGTQNNYETALTKRTTPHLYLSPEQTSSLQKQLVNLTNNPYKSDIWTLGMIILEAGLLQYQDECYRDELSRIHWETLQYNINRFGQAYSQEIKNMIEFMLSRDQRARPDWIDLEEHVMKSDEVKRSFVQEQPMQLERGSVISNSNSHNQANLNNNRLSNFPPPQTFKNEQRFMGTTANMNNGQYRQTAFSPRSQSIGNQGNRPNRVSEVTVGGGYRQPQPRVSGGYRQPGVGIDQLQISIVKQSIIDQSRPIRNIFPTDSYFTKTKIDENLIMVEDEDQEEQSSRGFPDSPSPTYPGNNQPFNMIKRQSQGYSSNQNGGGLNNNQYRIQSQNSPNRQYNQQISIGIHPNNSSSNGPINNYQNSNQNHNQNHNQNQNQIQNQNQNQQQGEYVVQKFKLGSRYQGHKVRGMRHGQGKFYYQDGGMYDGEWSYNKMEGYGKLYYQSGKLAYEGFWKADQFTGKGTLYNQVPDQIDSMINYHNMEDVEDFWVRYEGQFLDDMKNGHGTLFLSNDQKFEGEFESDVAEGYGVFYRSNGERINGKWSNNIKI